MKAPLGQHLAQNRALEEEEGNSMKNALREAMIGPSLIMMALSAMATGCRAQNMVENPLPVGPASVAQMDTAADEKEKEAEKGVQAVASSDKTQYVAGEAIQLTILATNATKKPIDLEFFSGQNFDFTATKVGEKEPTWSWSQGRMFTMSVRKQALDAGEVLTYKATWENAKPGKYRIEGKVTANGGIPAPAFEIEVG